jgi:arylsulfatase A-like enzyme
MIGLQEFHRLAALTALGVLTASLPAVAQQGDPQKPNVVIFFIDDLGYADIGPFGCTAYPTPRLDRLAAEGRKFTDFHSATAVCSASRIALLTGCYPERVSILGALRPKSPIGIHKNELTLAELLKQQGYATAIFGKWHLGDRRKFLPLQHGFDEYYGLPYSNDMGPIGPRAEPAPPGSPKSKTPPIPVFEGNEVVDQELTADEQPQLTTKYTERAVDFIARKHKQPFFLYVPHTMVHVPIFVSDKFRDKSGAGLYGDVMMEVDWSVGQVLDALEKHGVADNTLVVFTADNGPWLRYGNHGGSAGPLREGKGTMFEGGYRVSCLMRLPGKIPAGTTCDEFCTTMDLLPTLARLLNIALPAERPIDGHDIWPLMTGASGATSPYEAFYCYYGRELQAVRDRRWKLHLPHSYVTLGEREGGKDGDPVEYERRDIGLELFDLHNDIGETTNVADQHPDIVARLSAAAEQARTELGDVLTNRNGNAVRAPGRARNRQRRAASAEATTPTEPAAVR